jgi:hypothetical protein
MGLTCMPMLSIVYLGYMINIPSIRQLSITFLSILTIENALFYKG